MDLFYAALILLLLVFGQGVFLWVTLRKLEKRKEEPKDDTGVLLLQKQIQSLEQALDARMSESSRAVHETVRAQLGESARLIREITQEITSVKEIGRQTQSFAEQLQSLQDILKNPKQRGVLGEYYLETVLKNVLPPGMYQMQ